MAGPFGVLGLCISLTTDRFTGGEWDAVCAAHPLLRADVTYPKPDVRSGQYSP